MNSGIVDSSKGQLPVPGFVCIGVQKGGTTTLHRLLSHHPELVMPRTKELQYFTYNYDRGLEWYLSQWPSADGLRAEITPYYIFHPHAPERLHALCPDIKILILLRDPLERTLSQYFHSRRLGLEPLEIELALASEEERLRGAEEHLANPGYRHQSHQEHSYLSRSRYELQLNAWQHLFPATQILVLRSESLFTEPQKVWDRLQTFLGLSTVPFPAHAFGRIHAGQGEAATVSSELKQRICQILQDTYAFMESLDFE
ncbi:MULTISPECIES: sulfotransferase [unclassified Cyanobium]|uniref:sulfotransferase family protein n=1 Tax=unclassified Cyanobium TaxID=2627006 RepID=UPI0020CC0905|nr:MULTISPECIES: sulfotransferase [unclassified Cyanobium]MCP9859944.1 sulfotransferase [Cyanobium sp. Cruz-8H5]MCP9867132.1 sulfotransferase [Cyanobium sp. Cruz-8D1]